MPHERTFSIIKPDAVGRNIIGPVIGQFERGGLSVAAAKMIRLDTAKAEGFYAEHKGKEFYDPLIVFMTSGPCIVLVLEGEDAVQKSRAIMGKTNFAEAGPDTIRRRFGTSIRYNAVHGSDSPASAAREITYFFAPGEIFSRA
ncbi:MAG: nucleoside-diphosphate kinase [Spirochaetota bacterium]